MIKIIFYTTTLAVLQGLSFAEINASQKREQPKITLPKEASDEFLENMPEDVLPKFVAVPGNVDLESADGKQRVTLPRTAAEISEVLKNLIDAVGTGQPIPVDLTGTAFTKFADSLRNLYDSHQAFVTVQQLSGYALGQVLSGMSFSDALALLIESNKSNIPILTWSIAAFIATALQKNNDVEQVSFMTEKLASIPADLSKQLNDLIMKVIDKTNPKELSVNSYELRYKIPNGYSIIALTIFPDKLRVLTALGEIAYLWDLAASVALKKRLASPIGKIKSVALSANGEYVIIAPGDLTAIMLNVATGKVETLMTTKGTIVSVAISADGKRVLTGSDDGNVRLWKPSESHVSRHLEPHSSSVSHILFSPYGGTALTGAIDGPAIYRNVTDGYVISILKSAHDYHVESMAFSSNGEKALIGSYGQALLWDMSQDWPKLIKELKMDSGVTTAVAVSPDGKKALTGSGKTVRLWDLTTGATIQEIKGYSGTVDLVEFDPYSKDIITASNGIVYRSVLLPETLVGTILLMKLNQLGKEKVLANSYFNKIYKGQ